MDQAVQVCDIGAHPAQLESVVLVKHSGTPRLFIEFLSYSGRSVAGGASTLIGEITITTTAKTLRSIWEDAGNVWPSEVEGILGWLVDGAVRVSRGGTAKASEASPRVPAAGAPMLGSQLLGPGQVFFGRAVPIAYQPQIVQAPPLWTFTLLADAGATTLAGVFLNSYGRQVGELMTAKTISNVTPNTLWTLLANTTNRNNAGYTLGTGGSEKENPEVVAFEGILAGGTCRLGRNGLPGGTRETSGTWDPTVLGSRQLAAGTVLLGRFGS